MIASQSVPAHVGPESDRERVALAAARAARRAGSFADAGIRRAIAQASAYAEARISADALADAIRHVARIGAAARARAAAAPVWTLMEGRRAAAAVREAELAEEVGELLGRALDPGGCLIRIPPALDPAWLTSDAVGIAGAIVRDGPRNLMPILADALEDAGCIDPLILLHCRGSEPHARECWVARRILEGSSTAEVNA